MISEILGFGVVVLLAEVLNDVNVLWRQEDFNDKHNYGLNNGKKQRPESNYWPPGQPGFYSSEHVRVILSWDIVVHLLSSFCDLSPTVYVGHLIIKFFTGSLFHILHGSSELSHYRLLFWFCQIRHVRRKDFRHSSNISWDYQQSAARGFQNGNAKGFSEASIQKYVASV